MIAVSTENGKLIRFLKEPHQAGTFGFSSVFGFMSKEALEQRVRARHGKGLKTRNIWKCEFSHENHDIRALSNCQVEKMGDGAWKLITDFGKFVVTEVQDLAQASGLQGLEFRTAQKPLQTDARRFEKSLGIALLLVLLLFLFSPSRDQEVAPPVMEPVEVKLLPETQRAVTLPEAALKLPQELAKRIQDHKTKVAIAQNLGFLSMLGRKDLTKALGGAPTVPGASAGAGAGGHQGSGGELLVGLGEGVQRTTVGNSGVAGLGGVGTKGAGGGAGGYGNSMVGSGNGRGLSSIALSQDMILEGGLDRSVIQATIAKYLNQVRACYEEGLRKTPGLVGQVSVAFEIGGTGAVNSSNISKTSLGDSGVEQCIAARVLTWQFPQPRGGVNVKVNYPFMLRPVKS